MDRGLQTSRRAPRIISLSPEPRFTCESVRDSSSELQAVDMMAPPAIHNAAFWGKIDDLRAELAEGASPDLAYSEEWSDFDDTGPRAFTMTPLHSLVAFCFHVGYY